MNGKNRNQTSNHIYKAQFYLKKANVQTSIPKSSGICWSVNLMEKGEDGKNVKESIEFECFKDDKLRLHEGDRRPHMERANFNLFRKQKRIKWMEILNEEHDIEAKPEQSHAGKHQKINPMPMSIANTTKNNTMLNHHSISQGLNRQIHTSLQRKRQFTAKKTASSTKFHGKNYQTSLDRYEGQKKQITQKQMKFQIQTKPMLQRLNTQMKRKTKQELKRIYSPSRIFHKASKSSREFIQPSEQKNIFKAWQLSEDAFQGEIQEYTEQLFSCETLDLRPALKSPQRISFSRKR